MRRNLRRPSGLTRSLAGVVCGAGLVAGGCWMVRPWLALVVAGVLVMVASLLYEHPEGKA
jgi:hypothetical protein